MFTAAVVRVEIANKLKFEAAYGATRGDGGRPVFVDTMFDLASLTKLFVADRTLLAVERGHLDLDGPLTEWFPEWKGRAHEGITLRMLLAHTSGMNSGADYRELLGEDVEAFALRRELVQRPGASVIYSDLGFIALGSLLERRFGCSLAALLAEAGGRTQFRPHAALHSWIPATEENEWRGRVQGVVHDEKAYLMNGVAGHAGLFGTALDVAELARVYVAPRGELFREATHEQAPDPVLRRGLGWALKTSEENSCGRMFSNDTFGHTGFTGTCVWVDPQRELTVVLLTNALYFGRSDLRDLRRSVCDAALLDCGLQ